MITVEKLNDTTFKVTVQSNTTTTHNVTLSLSYHEKLTHNTITPEQLIEKSFEFLLQRESNTSILGSFDLPVINQYFPEYESTIQKMP
ncbi:MAG: hypothetical protein DRR16_14520 [Candidatus Parabeggiatoa sp. nov. 3]|nr:MAG: hypothetical protein DRR00_02690 [Gammaproteobacteria bacterium]RKZ69218.1 MAG: hypothetical protein DRQ99_01510 [Gammaproteobacteria bacterium]RKZ84502.1 MAG: hypothetical protein DRR16_14520 [Gammaproteobacteria bacterium]